MIDSTFMWTGKDYTNTYDLGLVDGKGHYDVGRPLRKGVNYHIGVIGTTHGKYYSIYDETYPTVGSLMGYIECPNVAWFQNNFTLMTKIHPETLEEIKVN